MGGRPLYSAPVDIQRRLQLLRESLCLVTLAYQPFIKDLHLTLQPIGEDSVPPSHIQVSLQRGCLALHELQLRQPVTVSDLSCLQVGFRGHEVVADCCM